jgi:hypothetical protein
VQTKFKESQFRRDAESPNLALAHETRALLKSWPIAQENAFQVTELSLLSNCSG